MSDITSLPIWRQSELLINKEISSVELCNAYYDRIGRYEKDLGAFISIDADLALQQAEEADRRLDSGKDIELLTGIPLAIKDTLITDGTPTTCGSRILEGFVPEFDCTAVAKLRDAGAVFLGKANMDEFAMGSSNEYSGYKVARNPWDNDRIPGGSSGGSAVAVSARLAAGALGTDTGGSVRQPAAMTGIVGLKPTYGRVSRFGLVAFGSSLDCIGPMTRNVKDAAIMLQTIAGHDKKDSTTLRAPVDDYLSDIGSGIEGLRIGVIPHSYDDNIDADVREAFDRGLNQLKDAGAVIREIELLHFHYAIPAYYIIACAEASSNLARFDGIRYGLRVKDYKDLADQYFKTRSSGFGPEVQRRIMLGTFVLSSGYYDAYYRKGTQVRVLIKRDMMTAFENVDLIVSPTAPSTAFKIGEKVDDPLQMYLADIFTVTANLAGVPAISMHCGLSKESLPIGFQFIAPPLQEANMLQAAYALEQALGLDANGPLE